MHIHVEYLTLLRVATFLFLEIHYYAVSNSKYVYILICYTVKSKRIIFNNF